MRLAKTVLLNKSARLLILGAIFSPLLALAQDLVPATSEDLDLFDSQLSENLGREQQEDHAATARGRKQKSNDQKSAENFGSVVSAEAKRLRDAGTDERKDFGKWVSSQRRKNEQDRANKDHSGSSLRSRDSGADNARTNPAAREGNGRGDRGRRNPHGDNNKN